MSIMTAAFIQDAITAESNGEQFPIDFDNVWNLVGYSTKGKRVLENNLIAEYDYLINSDKPDNHAGFSPQEIAALMQKQTIKLTIEGFKHFCLLAQTKQGRDCRQYFIDVEKAYRQNLERQFAALSKADNSIDNKLLNLLSEIEKSHNEYGKMLNQIISTIETEPEKISKHDLDAALIANRLGLAYNKSLKAYQMLLNLTMKVNPTLKVDDKNDYLYMRQCRLAGDSWETILQSLWGADQNWSKTDRPNSHKSRQLRLSDKYLEDWVCFLVDNGETNPKNICKQIYGKVNSERIDKIKDVLSM